jgi:hypothetical protein
MKITKLLLALAIAAPAFLQAQTGGPFELTFSTIGTGGGSSSGGPFSLSGTIGQPAAGTLSGGPFTIEGGFWYGATVLQSPGAPLLKIKLLGNGQAVISWPVDAMGFTLEESPCCSNATWTNCVESVVDTVDEHTVTISTANVMKVFRLKK